METVTESKYAGTTDPNLEDKLFNLADKVLNGEINLKRLYHNRKDGKKVSDSACNYLKEEISPLLDGQQTIADKEFGAAIGFPEGTELLRLYNVVPLSDKEKKGLKNRYTHTYEILGLNEILNQLKD